MNFAIAYYRESERECRWGFSEAVFGSGKKPILLYTLEQFQKSSAVESSSWRQMRGREDPRMDGRERDYEISRLCGCRGYAAGIHS